MADDETRTNFEENQPPRDWTMLSPEEARTIIEAFGEMMEHQNGYLKMGWTYIMRTHAMPLYHIYDALDHRAAGTHPELTNRFLKDAPQTLAQLTKHENANIQTLANLLQWAARGKTWADLQPEPAFKQPEPESPKKQVSDFDNATETLRPRKQYLLNPKPKPHSMFKPDMPELTAISKLQAMALRKQFGNLCTERLLKIPGYDIPQSDSPSEAEALLSVIDAIGMKAGDNDSPSASKLSPDALERFYAETLNRDNLNKVIKDRLMDIEQHPVLAKLALALRRATQETMQPGQHPSPFEKE